MTEMNRELKIKNLTVKNRIAIPPMVCFHWADPEGMVSEKNLKHYEELAAGGAGLVIVEATAVTKRGRLHETELGIWDDGQLEGLGRVAEAIHKHGAAAFIQLVHAGGSSADPIPEAPSQRPYRGGVVAEEMTKARIAEVREDFVNASLRAKKAGFDGVEFHGCHGYLGSQFLNSRNNFRTDEYGADKTLFVKETLKAIKKACGEDFIVGIRLGAFEPLLEDGLKHAEELADCTDFIDVSFGGDCNPEKPEDFVCSEPIYGAMKIKEKLPNMPVFGVCGVNSREDVINALNTGIDMVDVGHAALVDPAFPKHVLNNEEAGKCLNCRGYCRWNPMEMSRDGLKCPGLEKFKQGK